MKQVQPLGGVAASVAGFARQLAELYAEELTAVVLYGPAVRWDTRPKGGKVNVLVVIAQPELARLSRCRELVATWYKRMQLEPVFMGADELERSLDVFPVEFLEMQADYICLHGSDPLAAIEVSASDLRLQVEEALRTKALWLRQQYVREGTRGRSLVLMLTEAVDLLERLSVGLLRLLGQEPPTQETALLEALAQAYGLDAALLRQLLAVAERGRVAADEGRELLLRFDELLRALIKAIDEMVLP